MIEAKMKWAGGIKFEGVSEFGHKIVTDGAKKSGGAESGYKPVELLLYSMAGCTGVDVIKILEKMRQNVTGLEIEVKGEQPDSFPKPFKRIEVKYIFRGNGLDRSKIEQAIKLSDEKYCSVSQTVKGIAKIVSTYEIKEE